MLLPPLFHQLYHDLSTTFAEHVELVQCNPNYVLHYHDGEKVVLSSDRAQLSAEVSKWEGVDGAEGLEGFLRRVTLFGHMDNSANLIHLQGGSSACRTLLFPRLIKNIPNPFFSATSKLHIQRDQASSIWESLGSMFKIFQD